MPTYTYNCIDCGFEFDKRVHTFGMDGEPCPVCGSEALPRSVYAPNFRMGKAAPPPVSNVEARSGKEGMARYKERIDYEKKEHKKKGWDGDHAVEAVRKGRVEGEKGVYGLDWKKAQKAGA